jgi:hypothetical protein
MAPVLLILCWLLTPSVHAADGTPDIAALTAQLENGECGYSWSLTGVCERRPWWSGLMDWMFVAHLDYQCPLAAARCLEKLGPQAVPAVPNLLRALTTSVDYDTGDGVLGVRSAVAKALAATRDPRAIAGLAAALEKQPKQAEIALLQGLASFGTAAGQHWRLAAIRLEERNRDRTFSTNAREQYEQSLAHDLALEEIRRADAGKTLYVIPQAAMEAARKLIDRQTSRYRKEFESLSADSLAVAAVRALERMQRVEGVPVLVETIGNPHAAAEAAGALAALGDRSPAVRTALQQGLESEQQLGPRARAECARALGALEIGESAGLLRQSLADPDLAEAAARALGQLGAAARPAIPSLLALARQPSLAAPDGKAIRYSVEATRLRAAKGAAVRAIAAIDPGAAAVHLTPLLQDPDVRSVIRSVLGLKRQRSR